jgi:hypothetical protein
MMMEAISTSEMLLNFYQTTRRYNPEDSHLHKKCCMYTTRTCFNWLTNRHKIARVGENDPLQSFPTRTESD